MIETSHCQNLVSYVNVAYLNCTYDRNTFPILPVPSVHDIYMCVNVIEDIE